MNPHISNIFVGMYLQTIAFVVMNDYKIKFNPNQYRLNLYHDNNCLKKAITMCPGTGARAYLSKVLQ
jgi:hypothetical protein